MNTNIFQSTSINPYHLSIGAVLVNEKNEVVCHYFEKTPDGAPGEYDGLKNIHSLMRETMEAGETIEETLHRGIKEEFGATGEIFAFLGSQENKFVGDNFSIIKTTLYFLVRAKTVDASKRSFEDLESESEIVELPFDECISRMKEQWNRLHCETLNESEIVERAQKILE